MGSTVDLFRQALKSHPAPTRHQIHHQIERTIVAGPIAALGGHRRHLPRSSCVQCDTMTLIRWYTDDGRDLWRLWYLSTERTTPLEDTTTYLSTFNSSFSPRLLRSLNICWTFLVTEQNVLVFPLNKLSNFCECVDYDSYDYHRSRATALLVHSLLEL